MDAIIHVTRSAAPMTSDVLAYFASVRQSGRGWTARCPAHDDKRSSLSISRGDKQPWVFFCHAGCSEPQIVAAAGLTSADVMAPRADAVNAKPALVATYPYTDETGALLFEVVRFSPKDFRQRRPDGKGGWIWSLGDVRRVLFRLPELQGQPEVWIVEGERDCLALRALGLVATTNAGGAGKWRDDYTQQLIAAGVQRANVIPDNDQPGRAHADAIARSCAAAGIAVKVLELPGLPANGGDVSDYLGAHPAADLRALIAAAPSWTPDAAASADPTIGEPAQARRIRLTQASTIAVRPVSWLWQWRLSLGSIALLGGREGVGKTTVAATITADCTRGRLPGKCAGIAKSVIIAATEDSWEHTIVPRLMAAGADLTRVYRVDVETSLGHDAPVSLPRDLSELQKLIAEVDAALVSLDPLLSRLDGALDTHKDADVRQALEPLSAFADAAGVAVLGLIHVNKSSTTDPLTALMASRAFAAVARSVLFVMADPNDEAVRLLGHPKSNLGKLMPTLAFRVVEAQACVTPEGPVFTGKLEWLGESELSIREAMQATAEATGDNRTAVGEAADWLSDYLVSKGGAADSAEVKTAGQKAGHSKDALHRARVRLKLTTISVGFPRKTHWCQSSDQSSDSVGETTTTHTTATTGEPRGQLSESSQSSETGEAPDNSPATSTIRGGFVMDNDPCGVTHPPHSPRLSDRLVIFRGGIV